MLGMATTRRHERQLQSLFQRLALKRRRQAAFRAEDRYDNTGFGVEGVFGLYDSSCHTTLERLQNLSFGKLAFNDW